jgi:hypothetical protein
LLRDMPLSPAHRKPVAAANVSAHRHPVWIALPPPEYVPVSSPPPYQAMYVPPAVNVPPPVNTLPPVVVLPPVNASPPVNVPEPSSGIIFVTGILALVAVSRRMKND